MYAICDHYNIRGSSTPTEVLQFYSPFQSTQKRMIVVWKNIHPYFTQRCFVVLWVSKDSWKAGSEAKLRAYAYLPTIPELYPGIPENCCFIPDFSLSIHEPARTHLCACACKIDGKRVPVCVRWACDSPASRTHGFFFFLEEGVAPQG